MFIISKVINSIIDSIIIIDCIIIIMITSLYYIIIHYAILCYTRYNV